MARATTPVLLPCRGVSRRGVSAAEVTGQLAARGIAEVAETIEQTVGAAGEGRTVIAVDACAGSCQARLLDARGVPSLRALDLSGPGDVANGVAETATVGELEAAAHPFRRTRRTLPLRAGELSEHPAHSSEDYLLALDTLTSPVVECGVLADAPTLAAHVAQILGITRSSAGAMLDRLEDAGYVRRGMHRDVLLTPAGRAEADRVVRKQRVLECLVVETLGYGVDECYERAREIAAGFGDDAVARAWEALGRPARCPHGWPTDPGLARRGARGLLALSAVPADARVTVERVDETSRERLRVLADAGIEPQRQLDGVTTSPAAGMVAFTADGERRSISTILAASVLVRAA